MVWVVGVFLWAGSVRCYIIITILGGVDDDDDDDDAAAREIMGLGGVEKWHRSSRC